MNRLKNYIRSLKSGRSVIVLRERGSIFYKRKGDMGDCKTKPIDGWLAWMGGF